MKADKKIEKIVNWAEATRTSAARRGMLIEAKNGKIVVANREHTVALASTVNNNESFKFYSDEYPLGKYPEISMVGSEVVFTWEERGQKRKVSYPAPEKSYFEDVLKTFEAQGKIEGSKQRYKTSEFQSLMEEMKFTEAESLSNCLKLTQVDPRGIKSETEVKGESGTASLEEW